jgi:hypothetical protein
VIEASGFAAKTDFQFRSPTARRWLSLGASSQDDRLDRLKHDEQVKT